jgi:hypothetical protein
MPPATPTLLDRYLRHRRVWEVALWLLWGVVNFVANSVVVIMDYQRRSQDVDWWRPVTWELTSTVMLLALMPVLLLFERRFPIQVGNWKRVLPVHLIATVVYSVTHVVGMVALRRLVYRAAGSRYDFGDWPRELAYEYLKDVRTYAFVLGIFYLYRLLLLRLQGEARLLVAPDAGPPVEAVDRPARFLVRKLRAEFLVQASDIEWLEAAENYVNLHVRGHVYPLRSTMTAIEERLDPQRFVRVHRSYIVNLDFLERIEPLDTGDARLLLKNGTRIPCSRRYRQALREK